MRDLPGGFPRCGLPAPAPPRSRTHGNWTTKPAMGTVGAGVALWRGRDTEARRGGGNDRCGGGSELETRVGAQAYLLEVRTATYGRARRSVCGHRLTPPHTHTHTAPALSPEGRPAAMRMPARVSPFFHGRSRAPGEGTDPETPAGDVRAEPGAARGAGLTHETPHDAACPRVRGVKRDSSRGPRRNTSNSSVSNMASGSNPSPK